MASIPASAVLALIKAYRPEFRSKAAKIAFAAHALLVSSGCTLVACGGSANDDLDATGAPEASLDGWDTDEACYSFLYRTPAKKTLLLKCLALEDTVILHWGGGNDIKSLEVSTSPYTTDDPSASAGYKDFEGLVNTISPGLLLQAQDAGARQAGAASGQAARGGNERPDVPARHPEQPYGMPDRGSDDPLAFDDANPLGGVNPLMVGGSGQHRGGGGMHVGPDDPIFRSIRDQAEGRHPGGSSLPPGARFDPIAPEGVPGFHPDDFSLGQSRTDAWNDLGPPPGMGAPGGMGGPGRGGRGGAGGFGGFGGGMFG